MVQIILTAVVILVSVILPSFFIYNYRKKQNIRVFTNNITLGVYLLIRLITIVIMTRALYLRNYGNALICLLTLALYEAPSMFQRVMQVEFPTTLECVILVFAFAAEILGEINHFYVIVSGWDTALHVVNGFVSAAFGGALIDMLNREERVSLKLSPWYRAVAAFCFAMTIGTLWEFFEFSMDRLIDTDMQKDTIVTDFSSVLFDSTRTNTAVHINDITRTTIEYADGQTLVIDGYLDIGLIDTMKDLFIDFVGAFVFCTFGYLYARGNNSMKFIMSFIPRVRRAARKEKIAEGGAPPAGAPKSPEPPPEANASH